MRTGKELFQDAVNSLAITDEVITKEGRTVMELYFGSEDAWFETSTAFLKDMVLGLAFLGETSSSGRTIPVDPVKIQKMVESVFQMAFLLGYQFKTEVEKAEP